MKHNRLTLLWGVWSFFLLLHSTSPANASRTAAFYLEPHLGFVSIRLRAVEIENSFVAAINYDSEDDESWDEIDPEGIIAPVGRMVSYKGTGMDMGIEAGVKISGLKLGLSYSWLNVSFSGYSKRYRYMPELLRAGGQKLYDTSNFSIYRIMGSMRYGIPIWKFLLNLQTRIGALIVGDTALIIGRAAEEKAGFTGDVGLEFSIRPNKWISVGIMGHAGFFAFAGKYEGAMGGVFGGNGVFSFYF